MWLRIINVYNQWSPQYAFNHLMLHINHCWLMWRVDNTVTPQIKDNIWMVTLSLGSGQAEVIKTPDMKNQTNLTYPQLASFNLI